jgi:hypothetical protein
MTMPKFTAERSLYRGSERYHMVADKNIQSDEQSIIPQQAGWYCSRTNPCYGCYWNGYRYTHCTYRC